MFRHTRVQAQIIETHLWFGTAAYTDTPTAVCNEVA